MLDARSRRFVDEQRVARLATLDASPAPFVVPVCFVLLAERVYITIDGKPKSVPGRALKRVRNIEHNGRVALVFDHYDDEDWSRLAWVMLRGNARILESGDEHAEAQRALKARYRQYRTMALSHQPVIAIDVARVTSWFAADA